MKNTKTKLTLLALIFTACMSPQTAPTTQTIMSPNSGPYLTPLPETWIGDGGLVTGNPCFAPCFFGVIPNETSMNHVIPILREKAGLECAVEYETTIVCDNTFIKIDTTTYLVKGLGYISDISIPIGKILDIYGIPNNIVLKHYISQGLPYITAIIMFDEFKMALYFPETNDEDYEIEENTILDWALYLDDKSYQMLQNSEESLQLWDGYKVYKP